MMLYVKGYNCGNVLLGLIVVVLSISCDTGVGADDDFFPPPDNPSPFVDDTIEGINITTLPYSYLGSTDVDGRADLTQVLSSNGYLVPNIQNVEIRDSNNEALRNFWVYYWIDQQNDLLYIKTEDPNDVLADSYQVLSIRDSQGLASVHRSTGTHAVTVAPLISVIMRAYATYGTLSSIRSLFSLDIYFSEQRDELVFEGTIGEIYDSLSFLGAVSKLPVVLKRNIKSVPGKSTVEKASTINPNNASADLKAYLREIGGYILANDETRISVTLNMLDGRERYLDVEVLSDNPRLDPNMLTYFVRVAIEGFCCSFQYDIPFFWIGAEPDFYATIKAGDRYIKRTETLDDNYVTEQWFSDPVSILVGEEVEITILDDDLFLDDEVGRLVFNFDGYTLSYSQTGFHAGQPIAIVDIDFFLNP